MQFLRAVVGLCAGLVLILSMMPEASSLPRMSATSGAPCTTCHFNSDGGGLRSEIGWGTSHLIGAVDYDDLGFSFLSERRTNRVLDWMAVGGDVRVQSARLGQPSLGEELNDDGEPIVEMPSQRIFPMQFQPYVAIIPTDFLSFHGTFAPGGEFPDGDWCKTTYAGQPCWQAHATVKPSADLPTLRAGKFRPSIAMRHDDHTLLLHADAARSRPTIIPPNYAELGAELSYQPRHWIRVDAGGYHAGNLTEAIGDEDIVSTSDPAYSARVTYYPRFELGSGGPDRTFYGWVGASVYGAGSFRADQGYAGLGWLSRGALMVEVAHLDFGSEADRRAINAATILAWELREWFVAEARVEQAVTFQGDSDHNPKRRAAVAGLQFYPIPFVKIRPEYRFTRTDDWQMGQYTVQLHIFY